MLPSLERRDTHPTVIGNGRIDMNCVNFGVVKHVRKVRVTRFDTESVTYCVQFFAIPLADRNHVGVWMVLVNRDEFRTETQTDYRDIYF